MSYLDGGKTLEGVCVPQDPQYYAPGSTMGSSNMLENSVLLGPSTNQKNETMLTLRRLQLSSKGLLQQLKNTSAKHRVLNLDASRNFISQIPVELYRFENLTSLVLSYNSIRYIPSALYCSLRQLNQLDLSENEIEIIPEEMPFYLRNLTVLKMNNNRIRQLPDSIDQWKKVYNFQLGSEYGGNFIHTLPVTVSAMEDLVDLDLSFNQLDTILPNTFAGLSRLRYLNLSNNRLTHVPQSNLFKDCEALVTIDISDNQIAYIPGRVAADLVHLMQHHQLQLLNLGNNRINILPAEMLNQEHNARVIIQGNPIIQTVSLPNPFHTSEQRENNTTLRARIRNALQTVRSDYRYSNALDTFEIAMALREEPQTEDQVVEQIEQPVYQDGSQGTNKPLPVLPLSLYEISLRTLLSFDYYENFCSAIPKHIQEEVQCKKQLCFYCQKPFVSQSVTSALLRRYFSASHTIQQVKFCSDSCLCSYHISLSERESVLRETSNQIRQRTLENAIEPGSMDWIMAAVTAASLQEEQANLLTNRLHP